MALGCAVAGNVVYVTGNAGKGAGMVQGQETKTSQGGNNIWVSQMQVSNGTVNWMQQVGTSGDEQVACNGGIVTDNAGNTIVFVRFWVVRCMVGANSCGAIR
jgi:hypothetical protein